MPHLFSLACRKGLILSLLLVLLIPAMAEARRGRKAAPVQGASSLLDALTRPAMGTAMRASSADLKAEAVLGPGESLTLAELSGPGVIDRIWIAVEGADTFWRDILIRITWDGASGPSVEAPIGDFFAVGPGARKNLQSLPLVVHSQGRSFTSLWKMPFASAARIELVNEGNHETRQLIWELAYRKVDALPKDSLYFHAQYAQVDPPTVGAPMTVLRAGGRGQYVGMSLVVQNTEPGAWGTGALRFSIDGNPAIGPGAISVLGYFGNVFGLGEVDGSVQGTTLDEGNRVKARSSVYRFHLTDPVPFAESIELLLDHGIDNQRSDRMASVAYWYQDTPGVPFHKIASGRARRWKAPSDAELALWERSDELNSEVLSAYRRSDFDAARGLLEELLDLEPQSVYASYNLACLYALNGEQDKALHMLEQAIELGFTELGFARHDPDLRSLHEHARFRKLVKMNDPVPAPPAGK
ncbi:MAG: hypothetical protein CMP23_03165 [Rickettsiales bacterium]|nr:hypothetical protein [Rickettsiales bacterium]